MPTVDRPAVSCGHFLSVATRTRALPALESMYFRSQGLPQSPCHRETLQKPTSLATTAWTQHSELQAQVEVRNEKPERPWLHDSS